jgi:hypothetical protein
MRTPGSAVNRDEEGGRCVNKRCGGKDAADRIVYSRNYEYRDENPAADPQASWPKEQESRHELEPAEQCEVVVPSQVLRSVRQRLNAVDQHHGSKREVQDDERATACSIRHGYLMI